MKNRIKQKTRRKFQRIGTIILVIILIFLSYMLGFNVGSNNMPESQADPPKNGKYNIGIYEGGKVVITTRIQHILTDNNKLIIYGIPVHEPIE